MKQERPTIRLFKSIDIYYILIMLIFAAATFYANIPLAICEAVVAVLMTVAALISKSASEKKLREYVANIAVGINSATTDSITKLPIAMAIINYDGTILWYNDKMHSCFEQKELFKDNIKNLLPDFRFEEFMSKDSIVPIKSYSGRSFEARGMYIGVDNKKNVEPLFLLYLNDTTELENLKKRLEDNKIVIAIIAIDNYEEVMQNTDEAVKQQIIAATDNIVTDWAANAGGAIKKVERDRYIFVCNQKILNYLTEQKFDILDTVREIDKGNKIPVTLSIGIGLGSENIHTSEQYAQAALDMALGRGGDQIVIKDGEGFRYYGGRSKETEKRTKVKARVVAYALRELLNQCDGIIIMGHKMMDADSFGAALGLFGTLRSRVPSVHIILSSYDTTVANMLRRLENSKAHSGVFITRQQAKEIISEKTLLIVVDTHKPSLLEFPELLEMTDNIMLIDHHRRSAEFIDKAVLVYHSPYASSTCEMVTEIIQYVNEKVSLNQLDAEALYAGITIDTKNFTFKTGVRTFEAAAFLRRYGADTIAVKQLNQTTLEDFAKRADIVKAATVYKNSIAISTINYNPGQVLIAQAADELLNISGISAAFVLAQDDSKILISARSLGNINVQVVLEKLGGGGHMTIAGAQLEDMTLDKAENYLKEKIDEYLNSLGD